MRIEWLTVQFSATNALFTLLVGALVAWLIIRSMNRSFIECIRQAHTKSISQYMAHEARWTVLDARLAVVDEQMQQLDVRVARVSERVNIRITVPGKPSTGDPAL